LSFASELDAETDNYSSDHSVEVGGSAGWPVGIGFVVGYWGPVKKFPLVARFSTGFGSNLELGWGFANNRGLRAFVGASVGMIGYLSLLEREYYSAGPIVGLRFNRALWDNADITLSLGPAAGWTSKTPVTLSVAGSLSVSGLF
jgi:hypothetical protein